MADFDAGCNMGMALMQGVTRALIEMQGVTRALACVATRFSAGRPALRQLATPLGTTHKRVRPRPANYMD
ncbi:hypothetical protein Lal_00003771 [Lupinus albus]|nr:hypothetical protein Lal_00003771 [Lupinus albus]